MGGPCPGPNVSTGNSGQRQPLVQMVRSRALATVHQTHPLPLSCLAMAPSIMSQWNQRKLAPNYRLLSVKNGTGAAGVCQLVEAGWLTHCGTKSCRPHRGHRRHTLGPRRRHKWLHTHMHGNTHMEKAEPPVFLVDLCLSGVWPPSPPVRMPQQKPLVFHL